MAESAIQELLAVYPAFVERGRAELGKWVKDKDLLDATFEGLRLAGLATEPPPTDKGSEDETH